MEFLGHGITDRIRHIDRRGAGLDGGLDHFPEEIQFRARSVFGRELDVLAQAAGILHALDRGVDDLLFRHAELVLAMDRTRGQEHVDARFRRHFHGTPDLVDVLAVATRESGNDRALHFPGDLVHRLPVAPRGGRETGFDHVHAEFRQRTGQSQLLGLRHAAAGRLLAVAQRRVKNQYAVRVSGGHV